MRVAIIGGGPSGLCAVKYCISEGFEIISFEKNSEIGGEWYSTLEVGPDVHSKIYEGLLTNLPKEIMLFSDHSYDPSETLSFLTPQQVLKYIQSYADAFDLRKYVKLRHRVVRVRPVDDKWEIIVENLTNSNYNTHIFDAVFVCTGISAPWIPQIEGQRSFKGRIIHSRDYRSVEMFKNEKVLLIGSGASAFDMIFDIHKVTKQLTWVHKIKEFFNGPINFKFPPSVVEKPAIKKFTESGAEFMDGSTDEFTIIALATGYDYSFPFLSVDSGILSYDKCVQPMYKQCINANRTSLAIIGLPFFDIGFPMLELQIKFCLEFWTERKKFPSRNDMLLDISEDFKKRKIEIGKNNHKAHYLGPIEHELYYDNLAKTAGIEPLKPVLCKIFNHSVALMIKNFQTFRLHKYTVINDNEFSCESLVEA